MSRVRTHYEFRGFFSRLPRAAGLAGFGVQIVPPSLSLPLYNLRDLAALSGDGGFSG